MVMRETRVTFPELALIAGTRAALGAGLGLLLGDRLPQDQRRAVGWTLLLIGAATTVPLVLRQSASALQGLSSFVLWLRRVRRLLEDEVGPAHRAGPRNTVKRR